MRRKIPAEAGWETPTHWYPDFVDFEMDGDKGAPDVKIKVEMRDGVPEVTEFRMVAKPKGRAVRTSDLRAWTSLEGFALNEIRRAAVKRLPDGGENIFERGPADEREFWKIRRDLQHAQDTRRGPSQEELEEVAEVYRASIDSKPTEAVEVQMGYTSRRTAARRVRQARDAGLLPQTTKGQKRA